MRSLSVIFLFCLFVIYKFSKWIYCFYNLKISKLCFHAQWTWKQDIKLYRQSPGPTLLDGSKEEMKEERKGRWEGWREEGEEEKSTFQKFSMGFSSRWWNWVVLFCFCYTFLNFLSIFIINMYCSIRKKGFFSQCYYCHFVGNIFTQHIGKSYPSCKNS